jgi:DNA polymerase-1
MILDIEADNLLQFATKIHVVKCKPLGRSTFYTAKSKYELLDILSGADMLIGHNIYGYDLPLLEKVWNVTYSHNRVLDKRVEIIDTLLMSQYVEPDLMGHSLGEWGKRLGRDKIDYRETLIAAGALDKDAPRGAEFEKYHPLMEIYCERDCEVCELVYNHLKSRI